jgi:mRNA interferase RelE/StbE
VSAPGIFGAATQISSHKFDQRFFALPPNIQARLQQKIDAMGEHLRTFPHFRMEGTDTFRLRVGDYRIIYQFKVHENELLLIALGHRSQIYKR